MFTQAELPRLEEVPSLISPNGRFRVFVRDWNLWIRNVATDEETRLTTDGVKNYGYGMKKDGPAIVSWSPDSRMLVAYRQDQRQVKDMYQIVTRVGHRR